MANGRRVTGSRLLGEDLRTRRGHRSLEEVARLSRTAPFCDRVEPIAYSTLSMLERGLTMPSAQSLLTLSVIYQVPVEQFLDLIALEKYHAEKPDAGDLATLEHEVAEHLRTGHYSEAYSKTLACLEMAAAGAGSPDPVRKRNQVAATRIYSGIALWKLGWLAQASATFRDVVDDLAVTSELRGWAYQNLVEVERCRGRLASAHAYARDGLDLAERVGRDRLQGTFHATLANLKRDLAEQSTDAKVCASHLAEAMAHHGRAQAMALRVPDYFLLSTDLINEAVTLVALGDAATARKRLDQGMELAQARGFQRLQAVTWLERAKIEIAAGELEKARDMLWKSEREATAVDAHDLLFLDCFYLLKVCDALGVDTRPAYRKCLDLKSLQQGRFRELVEFEKLQVRREAAS